MLVEISRLKAGEVKVVVRSTSLEDSNIQMKI